MTDQRIESLGHAFALGLSGVLGDRLFGLYLLGAAAFPESAGKFGDVDFHAIVETPFDDAVDALHRELGPTLEYDLDGQYIHLPEATRSEAPRTQMWPRWRWPRDGAWALHRAHARAGRRVLLVDGLVREGHPSVLRADTDKPRSSGEPMNSPPSVARTSRSPHRPGLSKTHVGEILTNPIYAGHLRTGEPAGVAPLVELALFSRVQTQRERRRTRTPGRIVKRHYALRLRCAGCERFL